MFLFYETEKNDVQQTWTNPMPPAQLDTKRLSMIYFEHTNDMHISQKSEAMDNSEYSFAFSVPDLGIIFRIINRNK